MTDFTVERITRITRIWFDRDGDAIEVGEDFEGLDDIEVRYRTQNGAYPLRVSFPRDMAQAVADAIVRCAAKQEQG